jgi:Tfp pilus assembly protein FimT
VVGRGFSSSRPGRLGRTRRAYDRIGAAGFTLLETMMVMALALVVGGMAIPVSRNLLARSKATSATMEVATWFETARNRATAERRNFEMTFDSTQRTITVQRVESDLSKTPIFIRQLPETVAFQQFSGAPDTPDQFGATAAIEFDGPSPYMFTTEGMFTDANGDPSNGTIFLGKPGQRDTGAAVTVFGATGLLRSWQLAGNTWVR